MFESPIASGSSSIAASVAIIVTTVCLTFLAVSPDPSRLSLSATARRYALFVFIALTAVLFANSARADYASSTSYYIGGLSRWSAESLCQAFAGTTYTYTGVTASKCLLKRNSDNLAMEQPFSTAQACRYGGSYLGGNLCSGSPSCSAGQVYDVALGCHTPSCSGGGTWNGASCDCPAGAYPTTGNQCITCLPGHVAGQGVYTVGGSGAAPAEACVEMAGAVEGKGCMYEVMRSVSQSGAWAGDVLNKTGESCTVPPLQVEVTGSDESPASPQDCLASGKGYIQMGSTIQCVQNGTATAPVTTQNTKTSTGTDGTKTATTTVVNNYGDTITTTTSTTSVNTSGQSSTASATEARGSDEMSTLNQCGAPGQPACAVTLTDGNEDPEDFAAQLPDVSGTFDGEAEIGLLGGPLDAFLGQANTLLQNSVFLPELSSADCTPFEVWEGAVINFCTGVEIARDIFAWLLYVGACWFGWAQLTRALDRGTA